MKREIKIGVDIGGTFTDFVIFHNGKLEIRKVLSTPKNPAQAILMEIKDLLLTDLPLTIIHGSTVATNTLLERKGAKIALITTKGFEDIIFIGRQTRKYLYNLKGEERKYLVSSLNCFGLTERTLASGRIEKKVGPKEIERIKMKIKSRKIQAVAIVLINSYINSENEKLVSEELKSENSFLSVSAEILPEYREYERTSTTLVNAYVMPIVDNYLNNLEKRLHKANLKIMQSNEGFISSKKARQEPVRTILSGPAGGVVSAFHFSKMINRPKVITFDMGGTSTDVSLIDNQIKRTTESFVGDFPVRLPMVDIQTVGAGGGSIAYLDKGGALRVGPQSAGAEPGPACYGKSSLPTVTDANLVLGRLDPDSFLGGKMKIFPERSYQVIEKLARKLNKSVLETAYGIIEIANSNMERAIRVISVEKGYDPRNFILFSFGGAGGIHSVELAVKLRIPTVIIPKNAGVLSALGMLLADSVKDYTQSVLKTLDRIKKQEIENVFYRMVEKGLREMKEEGFEKEDIGIFQFVDVRYLGQSYEITVPYSSHFVKDFHLSHKSLYSYIHPKRMVEVVNLRVKCIGRVKKINLPKYPFPGKDPSLAILKNQKIFYQGKEYLSPVFNREKLLPGNQIKCSALIVDFESTAFIPPGYLGEVDQYLNLIISKK
ncbi:MAG: hydantoinase/oxoprolinase family protein [Candidatus Aminicenantia bacterium]